MDPALVLSLVVVAAGFLWWLYTQIGGSAIGRVEGKVDKLTEKMSVVVEDVAFLKGRQEERDSTAE